jgi:predicted restriction endonuclease
MVKSNSKGKRWTEDETVLALWLYFQLPFGQLHSGNQEIKQLAQLIDRTNSSVAMKLCNFASLDPKILSTGRKGLDGASKLDREMYTKFGENWDDLVVRAHMLWDQSKANEIEPERLNEKSSNYQFDGFEGASSVERTVTQRRGQQFFRRAVLANYDQQCCITGISEPQLLIASHIKPWSTDVANRHNPSNGLLLSATFDKAFDQGLMTVGVDLKLKLSRRLTEAACDRTRAYFAPFDERKIRDAERFDPEPAFLEWHSHTLFVDAE